MNPADLTTTGQRDGLYGVYIGVVSNNEDPDGMGRVKVEFPWRNADDESSWARIATPMAGKEMGTYFLPEVGDEVLLAFEGGDIHYPYVVGSLWNGKEAPPATNDDGKNDIRQIKTRSGHMVTFDDKSKGSVTVETAGGQTVTMDDDAKGVTIEDGSGNTVEMGSSGISLKSKTDVTVEGQNINLKGKTKVAVSGPQVALDAKSKAQLKGAMVDISSQGMFNLKSSGMLAVKSSAMLQLQGALVKIN